MLRQLSWPVLGTLRQARGRLLATLRGNAPRAVPAAMLRQGWLGRQSSLGRVADGLIALADAVEAVARWLLRLGGRLLAWRGLDLTAGLAWRGLAALVGIGLATTLVSALAPATDGQLSALTVQPVAEARLPRDVLPREIVPRDVRQQPMAPGPAAEGWIAIQKPLAMFALESPELDRQPPQHEARRRRDDSHREDTLSFGGFGEEKAHLVLTIAPGQPAADALSQPFIIALVREAAGRGLSVQRSGTPLATPTRFGPLESADATLNDGAVSRACIAFRKEADAMPLALSGWWCAAPGRPADRRQLSCLIERLDLVSAGDDRALRQAFARAELARQPGCSPPRLSASGRKASWLDPDGQPPALKTAARR